MASFTVYPVRSQRFTVQARSKREKIVCLPCTPPPTLETFSEKINTSTRSSIEIAGLPKKKKKKKMKKKKEKKMTRIVKSCMSRFSRGVLEASTMLLGIWIA